MDLDSVFDFLKSHVIQIIMGSGGFLASWKAWIERKILKNIFIGLWQFLKSIPRDVNMMWHFIKSCYGGENSWRKRVLACWAFFAKFLIPSICIAYFFVPRWVFLGLLFPIATVVSLVISLVIVASRIEVEKVTENRQSQEEKQKEDMGYIDTYREAIYQSMIWENNYGRMTYIFQNHIDYINAVSMVGDRRNLFINSTSGRLGFDYGINAIELILKDYGVKEISLPITYPEAIDYLHSIVAISDLIKIDRLEEAKNVRIRWNKNHIPSQT